MDAIRTRREPPLFRRVEVVAVTARGPHMWRVALGGDELAGFDPGLPGASVRLLLPAGGATDVVLPTWNGNEFLNADGTRPLIRTLTPLHFDAERRELDVEIVRHGRGPLCRWADAAGPGDRVAVSGTGRGYDIDPDADSFLIAGDESALPAISTLIPEMPAGATVQVLVELGAPDAELALPDHPGTTVRWLVRSHGERPGDALLAAVTEAPIDGDTRVWAAGEAAAVQRIRRHLFDERGVPRPHAVVRGYWKLGRGGD